MLALSLFLFPLGSVGTDPVPAADPPASPAAPLVAVWTDVDGDGRLDLFTLEASGPRLLCNRGDGGFEDSSHAFAGVTTAGIRGAAWADFDGDGRLDLFLGGTPEATRLLMNRGDLVFDDRTVELAGAVRSGVRSARVLDEGGDGFADLHLETETRSLFLRNQGVGAEGWLAFEAVELPGTRTSSSATAGSGSAPDAGASAGLSGAHGGDGGARIDRSVRGRSAEAPAPRAARWDPIAAMPAAVAGVPVPRETAAVSPSTRPRRPRSGLRTDVHRPASARRA